MAVYERKSNKSIEKILEKAKRFFGSGGQGLELISDKECCLAFKGGGGFVNLMVNDDSKKKRTVELETREWDFQVKEFMRTL